MEVCRLCWQYSFKEPLQPWEGDPEGLCLLHSNVAEKDQDGGFTALIQEKIEKGDHNFAKAFFPGGVSFQGVAFKEAYFHGATFTGEVDFWRATFPLYTFLSEATFTGGANFGEARFTGGASFEKVTFSGEAYFHKATFTDNGDANFNDATFTEEAYFDLVTFTGEAYFESVTFTGRASFKGATFTRGAYFIRTTFIGEAYFKYSTFTGEIVFEGAKIGENAGIQFIMVNAREEDLVHKPSYQAFTADFTGLEIAGGAKLRFQESSLTTAQFQETDVRRIDFDRVKWDTSLGRNAVYDEIRLREGAEDISFEAVERVYRELKSNYEDKKDFQRVGDFYYGEMEMHRLGKGWKRFFSLEQFYWLLSGYGERPGQAGLLLLGFYAVLLLLVQAAGLQIEEGGAAARWWEALLFVFEKGFLMRPEWAKPTGFWGRVVGVLTIILPAQAALFFLAVRNKLGRRR